MPLECKLQAFHFCHKCKYCTPFCKFYLDCNGILHLQKWKNQYFRRIKICIGVFQKRRELFFGPFFIGDFEGSRKSLLVNQLPDKRSIFQATDFLRRKLSLYFTSTLKKIGPNKKALFYLEYPNIYNDNFFTTLFLVYTFFPFGALFLCAWCLKSIWWAFTLITFFHESASWFTHRFWSWRF